MNSLNIRLDKYLSQAGIATRKETFKLVKAGVLTVNNQVIKNSDIKIDPLHDEIKLNGEVLKKSSNVLYIILNKPLNVHSTTSDELGRETVVDLINSTADLFPVGRLDADSTGLILLTNDGELAHKLTHPKYHIEKTYLVEVSGEVNDGKLKLLRQGIQLRDGITKEAKVNIINQKDDITTLKFIIHEGKHRQIRRMCGAVELRVISLKRVAFGSIELSSLSEGESRILTDSEINQLKQSVNLFKNRSD